MTVTVTSPRAGAEPLVARPDAGETARPRPWEARP